MGGLVHFFAQIEPELHIPDVITVPGILWFLGGLTWFFAAAGRRQGKSPRWKWLLAYCFMIFAAIAAIFGWGGDPAMNLGLLNFIRNDFGVRAVYGTKKLEVALFGSFLLPLISMGVMRYLDKREERFMSELVG